jgi:uncharacterized protein related to proFAR isomerase
VSPLSSTNAPDDVLAGLLGLHAFRTIYIADLNAIQKKDEHSRLIAQLASSHPAIGFWVDNGGAEPIRCTNIHHVLGSESIRPSESVEAIDSAAILSLDFRGADFLGPSALLENPTLWPERLILMTLARVGSGAGPDLERLAKIKQRAGTRRLYAAGGVRDRDDLAALRNAGIAGVLVASALHDGRLTAADLAEFS